ncbi:MULTISPECIES: hypothetical protein [unclassified Halomonas]|uniref:hypothetical protein n=1 Tax=unclassified Halomonas TaxID=2609666 RepID=UPI003F91D6B6
MFDALDALIVGTAKGIIRSIFFLGRILAYLQVLLMLLALGILGLVIVQWLFF